MINQDFEKLLIYVKNAQNIYILCHENPDMDTVGSGLALFEYLKSNSKNVILGCSDEPIGTLKLMPNISELIHGKDLIDSFNKNKPDLIITLDTANPILLGGVYERGKSLFQNAEIVNIDHHPSNTNYGNLNIVMSYASNAEIILNFFNYINFEFTSAAAFNLLCGLVSDTGFFTTQNTEDITFLHAHELLKKDVNYSEILNLVRHKESYQVVKLRSQLLSDLKSKNNSEVVWLCIDYDTFEDKNLLKSAATGISNFIRTLENVKISFLLRKQQNNVKVTLRSNGEINILIIASKFGGGGHIGAAGFILENVTLEKAERITLAEIDDILY